MGKKMEQLEKAGANVVVAIGLIDRIWSWWRTRGDAKAEAKRLLAVGQALLLKRGMEDASDAVNAGNQPCPEEGCSRPKWHPGVHR